MKIRFQDWTMQKHYEQLIKNGTHYKTASTKTIMTFKEYDEGGN